MLKLRRFILGSPLFLPLVAVLGAIPGGWWCVVPGMAVVLAGVCRLWRIACCVLLCALLAGLHTGLVEKKSAELRERVEELEVVELRGTVERVLQRGYVLNTGWNGARVVLRGKSLSTPGDVVQVRAARQELRLPGIPGVFNPETWMRGQGYAVSLDLVEEQKLGKPLSLRTVQHWGLMLREKLAARLMPPGTATDPARQVLCSLVLGDKSGAEAETMEAFRYGGCLHAFAVSGLHVGLVSGIFWLLFRMLRVRPVVIRPLILAVVGMYVLMTGCAVPAIRAYLMLAVLLCGYMLQRRVRLLNTWSFAALLILLADPSQLYNAGFLLSFGVYAVLCLALALCLEEKAWFGPDDYIPVTFLTPWEQRCRHLELCIRGAVIVSLSAWLVSVPITLAFFHSANTTGFLTNIVITPILPVVMFCGLLHLCLGGIPWLGVVSGWLAQKSALALLSVVAWFAELPYAYLPAQQPAPLSSLLVQGTNYGGSFTMLGNHGLLIDCGNGFTAEMKTIPTLFHAGYTPAVLLITSPAAKNGGGVDVLLRKWPELRVIHANELPPGGCTFETQAGKYTVFMPPMDASRRPASHHCPIVLWESPEGTVLHVGDAAYGTYAAMPESALFADITILGKNPCAPVPVPENGRSILLPNRAHASLSAFAVPPSGLLWLHSIKQQQ